MLGDKIISSRQRSRLQDQDGSPKSTESSNYSEDGSFEILDELHLKLQDVEKENTKLKQAAIDNVRVIAKLENANETLEAKV